MKIKAIAPWFGGKRNMANTIINLIGKHRVYWEVFCGSMAVLLSKEPCVMETVCDLHGDLINLAKVVQDEQSALDLYSRLNRTLMCDALCHESKDRLDSDTEINAPDVQRAYDYFVVSWLGRNGVAGTRSYNFHYCVRYTSNGGHAAKRWRSVIESIPDWHHRLMNVTILQRDAFDVLEKIEDKNGTVIYADPPYFTKGSLYKHDFEQDDHVKLAKLLSRFQKTRVVLSYYDDANLYELYPGWSKHYVNVTKAMSCSNSKPSTAVEVILVNDEQKSQLFD